jgi:hypothetical protein
MVREIQDIQTTDLGSDTRAISLIGNPWESMGVYISPTATKDMSVQFGVGFLIV